MKALVWTGPCRMEYLDVDYPKLEPGWVTLQVKATGICGSELSGYLGENSLRVPPLVMGHEFTGTVVELGEDVPEELRGKLVTVNPLISCGSCRFCRNGNRQLCVDRKIIGVNFPGAFAQYISVPASACYEVHDQLRGAMVEPMACSLRAVNRTDLNVGDVGVVIGAGIIGLMAVHVMRTKGVQEVVAVDTNASRLRTAVEWGCTETINPLEVDPVERVRQRYPEGVDGVVDAVGLSSTRNQAAQMLRRGGTGVLIGLHENAMSLSGNDLVRDEIDLRGTFCYSDLEFQRAIQLIDSMPEPNTGWSDTRILKSGDTAFQEQLRRDAPYSKIVLIP